MFAAKLSHAALQLVARRSQRLFFVRKLSPGAELHNQNPRLTFLPRSRCGSTFGLCLSNSAYLMVQSFVLLFQLLYLAARIAAGANQLLPQSIHVFLIDLQRGFIQVETVLQGRFGALISLGQELLQPSDLLLIALYPMLRVLHFA